MLDELLIKLAKESSDTITDRDIIPVTDDLPIKKVAFDIFRVENDPYEHLWLMEERDGQKFLIRAFEPKAETEKQGDWSAINDYEKRNVTLKYKNIPIARFSSSTYEFAPEEITTFKSALLDRINNDQDFVKELLADQPEPMKEAISTAFPEFSQLIKG